MRKLHEQEEDDIVELLKANNIDYFIDDKTCHGQNIDVSFKGKLREEQQQAMACILPHSIGTLSATTAFWYGYICRCDDCPEESEHVDIGT